MFFFNRFSFSGGLRDVLGRETVFVYDGENRLASVTEPGNRQYTITYDDIGLLSSVVDSAGEYERWGRS